MSDRDYDPTVGEWSDWITAEARMNGWLVDVAGSNRQHRATHVCLRDGQILVLFARPRGGKLLAQHQHPWREWALAEANENCRALVAQPSDAPLIREILADGIEAGG